MESSAPEVPTTPHITRVSRLTGHGPILYVRIQELREYEYAIYDVFYWVERKSHPSGFRCETAVGTDRRRELLKCEKHTLP
jgi:hypothetical protein